MAQVEDVWSMDFWDLYYPSAVDVVAERGNFDVEVVDAGGGGRDCVVVKVVAEVVDWGFGYAMELRGFAGGEFQGCIASQRASLALC
jgi:hypothetical protein